MNREIKFEELEKVMKNVFYERKDELEAVKYHSKTRAFAVAGIDLIYNYMKDVLEEIGEFNEVEEIPQMEGTLEKLNAITLIK